jgi:predicted nucleic acid-binding protein
MILFCDTSVLVAACIRNHPHYERARPVLEAIAGGRDKGLISAHSLAETYSALTQVPVMPRILPSEAMSIVTTNIRRHFEMVAVTAEMYDRAIESCTAHGLGGGKVYDALLLECARQSNADRIYTFNLHDFRVLAPDLAVRMAAP